MNKYVGIKPETVDLIKRAGDLEVALKVRKETVSDLKEDLQDKIDKQFFDEQFEIKEAIDRLDNLKKEIESLWATINIPKKDILKAKVRGFLQFLKTQPDNSKFQPLPDEEINLLYPVKNTTNTKEGLIEELKEGIREYLEEADRWEEHAKDRYDDSDGRLYDERQRERALYRAEELQLFLEDLGVPGKELDKFPVRDHDSIQRANR